MLGSIADLDEIIARHGIRTVYLVTPLGGSAVIQDVYLKLLDKCIAVNWVPDIFSLRLINHSVREIAGIPVLTLSETPLTGTSLFLKTWKTACWPRSSCSAPRRCCWRSR